MFLPQGFFSSIRWVWGIAFAMLLACHAQAAVNLIEETAYLEDASTALTFEQVQNKTFTPLAGALNQGYSPSVFWVRLKLRQQGLQDQDTVVFKILPTYLDRIELFRRAGTTTRQIVGDRYPQINNGSVALAFNFIEKFKQGEDPYYYIRLQTTSTSLMSAEAFTLTDFSEKNALDYLLSGLLLGVLGALFILAATYFYADKEVVTGTFLLKQLSSLVMAFTYLGYQRLLFSGVLTPGVMDVVTSMSILAQSLTTLLFYKYFFQDYKPKAWVNAVFTVLLLSVACSAFLFVSGHVRIAMHLNMVVIAFSATFLLLVPLLGIDWARLDRPIIGRTLLIAAQAGSLVLLLSTSLPSLGIAEGGSLAPYIAMLHAVMSSVIMLLMVRHRALRLDQDRVSEIAMQMNRAEQEKLQRERQEQFMAMLTHELKTPLALIRFAVRNALGAGQPSARIEQAVDDINAVIDRCQQVDKLDKGWTFAQTRHPLGELIDNSLGKLAGRARVHVSHIPLLELHTDVALFHIILTNLLENAIKYAHRDATIELAVYPAETPAMVCISVSNKAGKVGLPDKDQVFKKYYRSEYARTTTGSGLGLYIVKALTELLGGRIAFKTKDDWVTFELCLPLSKS